MSAIERGQLSEEEVGKSIRQYLIGEQPIAGIIVEGTGEKCGILECVRNGILKRGTGKFFFFFRCLSIEFVLSFKVRLKVGSDQ